MNRGLSLANKCQLIFSVAVLVILAAALSVPWVRTQRLVRENQFEVSRQLAETWLENGFTLGRSEGLAIPMRVIELDAPPEDLEQDAFLAASLRNFERDPELEDAFQEVDVDGRTVYRYVRAIRQSDRSRLQDVDLLEFSPRVETPSVVDPIRGLLVIDRTSPAAAGQLLRNRIWIVTSGLGAGLLAILVFHVILTKLILSPVRQLRETIDRVKRGDLAARSTDADRRRLRGSCDRSRRDARSGRVEPRAARGDERVARPQGGRALRGERRPLRVEPAQERVSRERQPRTQDAAQLDHRLRGAPRRTRPQRSAGRPQAPALSRQHPHERAVACSR